MHVDPLFDIIVSKLKSGMKKNIAKALNNRVIPIQLNDTNECFCLIGDLLHSKQILLAGESSHGTKEFFELKINLFKFLACNHGYNVFLLETYQDAAEKVNQYIHSGEGDVIKIMKEQYRIWQTSEMLHFIEWMKNYNSTHKKKLHFHGFDLTQEQKLNSTWMHKREKVMASNITTLITGNNKYFCWTHNYHSKMHDCSRYRTVGYLLRKWNSKKVYSLGLYFEEGEVRALDYRNQNYEYTSHKLEKINPEYAEYQIMESFPLCSGLFIDITKYKNCKNNTFLNNQVKTRFIGYSVKPDATNTFDTVILSKSYHGIICIKTSHAVSSM